MTAKERITSSSRLRAQRRTCQKRNSGCRSAQTDRPKVCRSGLRSDAAQFARPLILTPIRNGEIYVYARPFIKAADDHSRKSQKYSDPGEHHHPVSDRGCLPGLLAPLSTSKPAGP